MSSRTAMRLALVCLFHWLFTFTISALPIINDSSPAQLSLSARGVANNDDSISLFKRGDKAKWVPYKDLHKPGQQQDFKVHVRDYEPKKSVMRRLSSGVAKKPFFTFAVIGSGLLALNTYIVAEAIRRKEDKIMQMKIQKGELPVVIPDLPPLAKKAAVKKANTTQQSPATSTTTTKGPTRMGAQEQKMGEGSKEATEGKDKSQSGTQGSS